LTPLLLALAVWVYGPTVFTVALSFLDWNLTTDPEGFVGLANYTELFEHPEFTRAAWQTVLYALALLPFSTVVPFVLAVLLWMRPSRASTVYRSLLFVPAIMAPVAVAVAWRFLLNPLQGLVAGALGMAGLAAVNWLGDPATALAVVVAVTAPKVTAFNMLLCGAALASLDRRVVEAARIEGATSWEVIRFVVVPHVAPTLVALALLSVVLAGQWVFTNISELTAGGPDGATDNVYFRIYTLGFDFFDTGEASAAAVVVLLAFAVLAVAWQLVRRSSDVRS
ncbi:sugar ABC transporter permease, partial [Nocardioides sp.]|uniref:carbohydrate ABC transporter permease n=1 Tax=Nocardioides sp. TaxID=35761 RepID=UPI0019A09EB9